MGAFDTVKHITLPDPDNPEEAKAFREKWGWDPHEQVIIRGTYTAGHMAAVSNASVHSDIGTDGSKITLATGDGRLKLMECMILGWTFRREDGREVAVSPHTIQELPYNYMTPILEVCDKLAAMTLNKEQEDHFLTSANGHIEGNSGRTKLHLTK